MTTAARDQHHPDTAARPDDDADDREGTAGARGSGFDPFSRESAAATQTVDTTPGSARPEQSAPERSAAVAAPDSGAAEPAGSVPAVHGPRAEPDVPPRRAELAPSGGRDAVRYPPRTGWRAALYSATGGLWNLGESEIDRRRRELQARARQKLAGCYRVATVSAKGGVGKSTTTIGVGSALATLRGDRVLALDANPDRGNLAEKVARETTATVRDLLADAEHITSAGKVRDYTSQGASRLEVLASESNPDTFQPYQADDHHAAIDLLSRYYNILFTDCGTDLHHSALRAAVEIADSLLIITSASIDGARAAQDTIERLEASGHHELVERSITVVNGFRPRQRLSAEFDAHLAFFTGHTRAVVWVPFDEHLDQGAEIDLDALAADTRDALLELAAVVADDFARPGRIETGARRRTSALLPGAESGFSTR